MKTVIAVLAVLAVAAVSVSVEGTTDATWVSNRSSKPIRASINYHFVGHADFQNRLIPPGTDQRDVYSENCEWSASHPQVGVTLWIDGSKKNQTIRIDCDQSIVGKDNSDQSGVDIYDSVYKEVNVPTGSVLITLYP